jgi:hypothetical protein
MSLPTGRTWKRVRSRGLPSKRGLDRKRGIMTMTVRRLLVVDGARERPTKAPSPALGLRFSIAPASPPSTQQKGAQSPQMCRRLPMYAVSVGVERVARSGSAQWYTSV